MPRSARIHVTGGLFHVISRFHDRKFFLDIDGARGKYLELLGKASETHDSRILAYCLMSSHVHLVLQVGNDAVGRLTKQVHAPFANWINRRRTGLGTVFADRPDSVLVHSETHGMSLLRYVHNNPVRAGVAASASECDWSSHRAYAGLAETPDWLAIDAVFGSDEGDRELLRRDLARFVDEGRQEGRRPEFSGEVSRATSRRIRKLMGSDIELSYPVLGPDDFVVSAMKEQVHRQGNRGRARSRDISAEEVVGEICDALELDASALYSKSKAAVVARGRALCAWLWVEKLGYRQIELADALQLSPEAVTMMLGRLRRGGLQAAEEVLVDGAVERLMDEPSTTGTGAGLELEPKLVIMKRQRR